MAEIEHGRKYIVWFHQEENLLGFIDEICSDTKFQITFFKQAMYFTNQSRIHRNTIHFIEVINYKFIGASSTTFSSFFIKPQQCSMVSVTRISLPTRANSKMHIPASGIHSSNTFSSSSNICINTKFGPMGMYSALSKPERKICHENKNVLTLHSDYYIQTIVPL